MGRVLAPLAEIVHAYDCDVLLLSGRPSRLPGIRALVMELLPLPPERVISLHEYRVGAWYPFRDARLRVEDPKTTVAVGAMIAALAQSQLPDFSFRSDLLRSKSIAKFIGKLDGGGRLQREDLVYRDVDLDNREYELPEVAFEFRGPMWLGARQLDLVRWPAARLYALEFAKPEYRRAPRARDAVQDRARRASSPRTRTRATSSASACARSTNRDGRAVALDRLTLRLQTSAAPRGLLARHGHAQDRLRTMDTVDLKLAQDCESLAVAASEGVDWLKDAAEQSPTVAQQAPSLISELQKVRNQSRKLARAARRRMCVGVFGPSQAGKSYLVSILASRDGRPLQARFADKTYDFLREINPPGNRESTGLVTRFGLGLSAGDDGLPGPRAAADPDRHRQDPGQLLPARLRPPEGGLRAARRRRHPQAPGRAARPGDADAAGRPRCRRRARPDRVFRHLLRRRHRRAAHRLLARGDRAARRACPAATAPGCGRCCGTTSSPSPTSTCTLYDGLQKLAFAPEALLGMDALIPREKSIVDVLTLDTPRRRRRRHPAGAAQAGRRPRRAPMPSCRARWSAR